MKTKNTYTSAQIAETISATDAALALAVSRQFVSSLVKRGHLEAVRAGRRLRITRASLRARLRRFPPDKAKLEHAAY